MKARGSITQLLRNRRPGYIQGEDGRLVAFDESALGGLDPRELSVGDWVEYEELDRGGGRRAAKIKPLIQRAEEWQGSSFKLGDAMNERELVALLEKSDPE